MWLNKIRGAIFQHEAKTGRLPRRGRLPKDAFDGFREEVAPFSRWAPVHKRLSDEIEFCGVKFTADPGLTGVVFEGVR